MKVQRLALFTVLALGAVACAADRNKDVKSAEADLSSEQAKARQEQADLDWKHAQEQAKAQQSPMTTGDRAELRSEQIDERAEMNSEQTKDIATKDQDVTKAHAAMQAERSGFEADAKERFNKLAAKADESKTKSAKLNATKQNKFNSDWNMYKSQKAEVQKRMSMLGSSSNEEWAGAKENMNTALDNLEAAVKKLDDDL